MDNLTHSLVGAGLAATGLRRLTPLATVTMVIGANFPDIDAVYGLSSRALELRRGLTHGLPAHVVLPFVLTGLVLLWDRAVRRRRHPAAPPVRPGALLLVATIAIWTHAALDHLNTYGVRWLMPFSERWFYGDTLFIVDPWLWLVLGVAVWWARRRWLAEHPQWPRPARVLMSVALAYTLLMAGSGLLGRGTVRRELAPLAVPRDARLMVAPRLGAPFQRDVVFVQGDAYRTGRLDLLARPAVRLDAAPVPAGMDDPAVARALAASRGARAFVRWSRFPFARVVRDGDVTVVQLDDLRYGRPGRRSFAFTEVRLSRDVAAGTASRAPRVDTPRREAP